MANFDTGSQSETSPLVQYLNWQIEQHERQLEHLRAAIKNESARNADSVEDFRLFSVDRVKLCLREFERVTEQRDRLRRERLRLIGDIDFQGENYLV